MARDLLLVSILRESSTLLPLFYFGSEKEEKWWMRLEFFLYVCVWNGINRTLPPQVPPPTTSQPERVECERSGVDPKRKIEIK